MIEVIRGSIIADGKQYTPGQTIKGLSRDDEARLVKKGIAKYVKAVAEKETPKEEKPAGDTKTLEPATEGSSDAVKIEFDADQYIEESNTKPKTKPKPKTGNAKKSTAKK